MRLSVLFALSLAIAGPYVHAQSPVPIASFVKDDQFYLPRISPDGKHLAVTVRTPVGKRTIPMVTFYTLPEMKLVATVRMPLFSVPVDYTWVSNKRLVVEKGLEVGSREKPQATGEILAMDFDGTHQEYLYGANMFASSSRGNRYVDDFGFGRVSHTWKEGNDHVVLGTYLWNADKSALYDVDSRTAIRKLMATIDVPSASFVLDSAGKPRFANGTDEQNYNRVWRFDDTTEKWNMLSRERTGSSLTPFGFSADGKQFFAWHAQNGEPDKLIREDLASGERTVLAEDPHGEISEVMLDPLDSVPMVAVVESGRPRLVYLDPAQRDAVLLKDLSRQFPGTIVWLEGGSRDGEKLLFKVSSDRDPGAHYLYDRATNKADLLFAAMADIEPEDMAARRPISFKARDGVRIDGYLTMPRHAGTQKPPLILLPHGGPHGVYDTWFFDRDAQFLASRGYAVLQLNYRGSSGRGLAFRSAGYRQWGGKIMDDLVDGVNWTVAQGQVDGSRMCVYGVSFGGYAALMLAAREPELFKCAVGYAGIYDLSLLEKEDGVKGNERLRSTYKRYVGDDAGELARFSPSRQAGAIKAAVLLIHGGKDKRSPKEHAFLMKEALEKAGHPPEWYYVDYEGHGFYDTENQTEVYERMEKFLAKYLGPQR